MDPQEPSMIVKPDALTCSCSDLCAAGCATVCAFSIVVGTADAAVGGILAGIVVPSFC